MGHAFPEGTPCIMIQTLFQSHGMYYRSFLIMQQSWCCMARGVGALYSLPLLLTRTDQRGYLTISYKPSLTVADPLASLCRFDPRSSGLQTAANEIQNVFCRPSAAESVRRDLAEDGVQAEVPSALPDAFEIGICIQRAGQYHFQSCLHKEGVPMPPAWPWSPSIPSWSYPFHRELVPMKSKGPARVKQRWEVLFRTQPAKLDKNDRF
ncbi:hypothetical protein HYDPIDRAFT_108518 [Hydnomerulius pinastri MD-312]|nr:hypothetical protein HYDPIDRAFT_108518 [Hydnomerulius pinastri MD-312]